VQKLSKTLSKEQADGLKKLVDVAKVLSQSRTLLNNLKTPAVKGAEDVEEGDAPVEGEEKVPTVEELETLRKAQQLAGGFDQLGLEVPERVTKILVATEPYKDLLTALQKKPELGKLPEPALQQFEALNEKAEDEAVKTLPVQVQPAFVALKEQVALKAKAEKIFSKAETCEDVSTLKKMCSLNLGLPQDTVTALKALIPKKPKKGALKDKNVKKGGDDLEIEEPPVEDADKTGVTPPKTEDETETKPDEAEQKTEKKEGDETEIKLDGEKKGVEKKDEKPAEKKQEPSKVEEVKVVVLSGADDDMDESEDDPLPIPTKGAEADAAVNAELDKEAPTVEEVNKLVDAFIVAVPETDREHYINSKCMAILRNDYKRLQEELLNDYNANDDPTDLETLVKEKVAEHMKLMPKLTPIMTEKIEPVTDEMIIKAILSPTGILDRLFLRGYDLESVLNRFELVVDANNKYRAKMAILVPLTDKEAEVLSLEGALAHAKETYLPALTLSHFIKKAFPKATGVEEHDIEGKRMHLAPTYLSCCASYSVTDPKCVAIYNASMLFYDFNYLDPDTRDFGTYGRQRLEAAKVFANLEKELRAKVNVARVEYKNGALFAENALYQKMIASFLLSKGPRGSYTADFMDKLEHYEEMMQPILENTLTQGSFAKGIDVEIRLLKTIQQSIITYEKLRQAIRTDPKKPLFQEAATFDNVGKYVGLTKVDNACLEPLRECLEDQRAFIETVYPTAEGQANTNPNYLDYLIQMTKIDEKLVRMELYDTKKPVLEAKEKLETTFKTYPAQKFLTDIYNRQKKKTTAGRYFELVVQLAQCLYKIAHADCLKRKAKFATDVNFLHADRTLRFAESMLGKYKIKMYRVEEELSKLQKELKAGGCTIVDEKKEDTRGMDICACYLNAGTQDMQKKALDALGLHMLLKEAEDPAKLQAMQEVELPAKSAPELLDEFYESAKTACEGTDYAQVLFKLDFLNGCKKPLKTIKKKLQTNAILTKRYAALTVPTEHIKSTVESVEKFMEDQKITDLSKLKEEQRALNLVKKLEDMDTAVRSDPLLHQYFKAVLGDNEAEAASEEEEAH